ncbi:MAG: O-antigen ligase family protein [Pseudomonadota bacterium]
MRLLTIVLVMFALFLVNADGPRVGEEERRVWTPLVLALIAGAMLLRLPILLRVDTRVVLSYPSLLFLGYLICITVGQFWSVAPTEGKGHILLIWLFYLTAISLASEPVNRTVLVFLTASGVVFFASWTVLAAGLRWALSRTDIWRLKGVMLHEQMLGFVCIMAIIMALIWMLNRHKAGVRDYRFLIGSLILVALLTLVATKVRAFSAYFLFIVFVIFFFQVRGPSRFYVLAGGVISAGGLYILMDVLLPLLSRGEQDETLSGRTLVWEVTFNQIVDRPFTGFGFATYPGYFEKLWGAWSPAHAHNLWLQVWFENGVVAMILFGGALIGFLINGYRFQRQTGLLSNSFFLALFCLLASVTSVIVGAKMGTFYGMLLLLYFQEENMRVQLGTADAANRRSFNRLSFQS